VIYPNDRTDPYVLERLGRDCHICKSPAGEFCTNMPITADRLHGRLVHHGR
jgi:hypothetical protein